MPLRAGVLQLLAPRDPGILQRLGVDREPAAVALLGVDVDLCRVGTALHPRLEPLAVGRLPPRAVALEEDLACVLERLLALALVWSPLRDRDVLLVRIRLRVALLVPRLLARLDR